MFSQSQMDKFKEVAEKSKQVSEPQKTVKSKSINKELNEISDLVVSYFKDSNAILITDKESLSSYIDAIIEFGYAGIDTETTGLDRIHDHLVGASLYVPGKPEAYIPMKHLVPIFEVPYKGQLSYEEVAEEFKRIEESNVRLIFANADFDLSFIFKDLHVDFCDRCYYDVILAWRCMKENEPKNDLKSLYNKYVLKGKGDPMKFSDFFTPSLFPFCKPSVASLYAANDAKITYELFKWQLPYCTEDNPKCKRAHLEAVSRLIWGVEFPLIKVCQKMHRTGMYLDMDIAKVIQKRYKTKREKEVEKLQSMVQEIIDSSSVPTSFNSRPPFVRGKDFNPNSPPHVKYLLYTLMGIPKGKSESTDKNFLNELNLPVTNQILKVRSLNVLINTFVDKMPNAVAPDGRIHAQFKQIGADTGRLSSAEPNMMNIPSHATDIRHMFRATPGYVLMSSDFSQQEPRLCAFVANDEKMVEGFKKGQDAYAMIASVAFNKPYESCLEFHPETHEYQPEGKARRTESKSVLLGVLYGRSIPSIAEQLYGHRDDMDDDQKVKAAQKVFDSVMNAFPGLRNLMLSSQERCRKLGYTETILGRRRHLPDMQLPEFEFKPLKGYVNPDVDPLNIDTLKNSSEIPERIVQELEKEFKGYKYFGQIAKRTKQLHEEEHIRVINNRPKINDATRQVVNSIVQGSAADLTKMAILRLENNEDWKRIGGRLLTSVHDELICEAPIEHAEEASRILSDCMCSAADFLPFPINCDVETTFRWYGLDYICNHKKPTDVHTEDPDEIMWIQYHLIESEYILPVFNDENGDKPRGDAAKGVNGKRSPEMEDAIKDYIRRYRIDESRFIDFIEEFVSTGLNPNLRNDTV